MLRKRLWWMVLSLLAGTTLLAQNGPNVLPDGLPLGLRFTGTRANTSPASCGCFFLYGGAADLALPLRRSFRAAVEVAGNHAGNVPGTVRGLSTITLLAGPRYSLVFPKHQHLFAQALFGAVRGFDADFRGGANATDTATAFAYALGGGYEVPLSTSLSLRAAQVEFVQTNLPNGSDNRQHNVRFGAGLVLRIRAFGAPR